MPQALSTDRLHLRPLAQEDVHGIFSIFSNPEVTRFSEIDPTTEPLHASVLLDFLISSNYQGILLKGTRRIVGVCGLFAWNVDYASATLGYHLSREYWGRGLMSEALRALLDFGFEEMRLNRINAVIDPANAASIKTIERIGFQCEGTMRELGFWKGQFHDMRLFSLLQKEWRPATARLQCAAINTLSASAT